MNKLQKIYNTLYSHYGNLNWWPADTPFEVIVGTILTQNTAWSNVEKAIERFEGDLSPERVMSLSMEELQEIIRPAGFFRQKAQYLKAVTEWFMSYDCNIDLIRKHSLSDIRLELLKVRGVGNETADSILLYAFGLPSFVVDAYTMRFFRRFPVDAGNTYMEVKNYCKKNFLRILKYITIFMHLLCITVKSTVKRKRNVQVAR